ncbi:MAG: hypothetical protein DI561_15005 [Thauera sp.]|nr:MAG: hypothetical protein DI561_15005 [Thauera sp.]
MAPAGAVLLQRREVLAEQDRLRRPLQAEARRLGVACRRAGIKAARGFPARVYRFRVSTEIY